MAGYVYGLACDLVMARALSPRLTQIVEALPLEPGMRVIEIGCGPGAAARAVAHIVGADGHVLAIDRSAKSIRQAATACAEEIASGLMSLRLVAVEDLSLDENEALYDIAFAIRVGALDGRHPEISARALSKIAMALTMNGRLFIDGGSPLREIDLSNARASVRAVATAAD